MRKIAGGNCRMVKKVKSDEEIARLEKKIEEIENRWKRAAADYQNLKKRGEKERQEFTKYANIRLLNYLLPIYDALENAVEYSRENDGIELILNKFADLLKSEKVEKIEVEKGEKFDPEIMEAIKTKQDKSKTNTVGKVLRSGFIFKDKLLRPVEVEVYI